MYLLSWIEEQSLVEASLGGKVTAEEISVLKEEILELMTSAENAPVNLLIDCARAKAFDASASKALYALVDECGWAGTHRTVCIPCDELDVERHTVARFQNVLEGREEYTLDGSNVAFDVPAHTQIRLAG